MCGGDVDAPEASPYEAEMLNQAENRLKEYKDTFIPLENAWMRKNKLYGSDIYKTKKQNEAVAAAKQTHSGVALAGPGMKPGSGAFLMGSQTAANASGAGAGMATTAGADVALSKKYGGALDVTNLGRNQTATSANLNSTLASNAAGVQAAQHRAAQMERSDNYAMAGTIIGAAGMGAYNKWGGGGKPLRTRKPTPGSRMLDEYGINGT